MKERVFTSDRRSCTHYLDVVFDFPCKVLNDKGGLHDRRGDEVFVPLVLLFEFG